MFRDDDNYIGKLVGNTGEPDKLTVALRTSFSARRGEFVRVAHQERESENEDSGHDIKDELMAAVYVFPHDEAPRVDTQKKE